MTKTAVLTGSEVEVTDLGGQNAAVKNLGDGVIYASISPNVEAGADNVVEIPAGGGEVVLDANGTVYLLGTGKVQCTGTPYATPNFKMPSSSTSGGGGGTNGDLVFFDGENGFEADLPAFTRQIEPTSDRAIYFGIKRDGAVYLEYEKSWGIRASEDYYTDANVITSARVFDFSKYSKIIVTSIPFKNYSPLTADVYFKAGEVAPSKRNVAYDFSDWTHICSITKVEDYDDDHGEASVFEINIADVNTQSPISFGITHGTEVTGYSAYFHILKIDFKKD